MAPASGEDLLAGGDCRIQRCHSGYLRGGGSWEAAKLSCRLLVTNSLPPQWAVNSWMGESVLKHKAQMTQSPCKVCTSQNCYTGDQVAKLVTHSNDSSVWSEWLTLFTLVLAELLPPTCPHLRGWHLVHSAVQAEIRDLFGSSPLLSSLCVCVHMCESLCVWNWGFKSGFCTCWKNTLPLSYIPSSLDFYFEMALLSCPGWP